MRIIIFSDVAECNGSQIADKYFNFNRQKISVTYVSTFPL